MKNTGIIYSSTERTSVVLPEMAELLPPLSEEQLGALETDLLKNGCYTSIIVNEDLVVIDGHNRKSLCDKHGLPYYVWFKNNCPLSGPLYDDVRFEPLHGDRNGRYFVVIRDSPHETHKWTIYTERHGFEQPEFTCANVRDMLRHINSMAPETWRGDPQPAKAPRSPQKKRKEAER